MEQIFSYSFLGCVWFGIILAFYLELTKVNSDTFLITVWKYFSYYTGITNVLVGVFIACIIFFPDTQLSYFFRNSNVSTAITLYIASVGIGNYVAFGFQRRPFWNQAADLLMHGITPALSIVYWFLFTNKSGLTYSSIPFWLIYPLCYAVYTIVHGPWTRFYPYPFSNVETLGWKKVGANTLMLTVSVVVASVIFVSLGKLLAT